MTCTTATKDKTVDPCHDQITSYAHETIGGQDFVKLPGGQVTLGDSDTGLYNPVHSASVAPLLVATTEVANAQMDAYIAALGTKTYALVGVDASHQVHILARGTETEVKAMNVAEATAAANLQCGALMYTDTVQVVPPADRLRGLSAEFAASDHPAVRVSWYDAIGYTDYMSKKTGREVRLLTEDEWEYAAKGGKDFKYATTTGELSFEGHKLAQYDANTTSAVGQTKGATNPYGLSDMTGNVWEWTSSVYDATQPYLILRGGSWVNDNPQFLRAAYRFDDNPDDRNYGIGFRVAVAALPQDAKP